jgi:hypothetical protein
LISEVVLIYSYSNLSKYPISEEDFTDFVNDIEANATYDHVSKDEHY